MHRDLYGVPFPSHRHSLALEVARALVLACVLAALGTLACVAGCDRDRECGVSVAQEGR